MPRDVQLLRMLREATRDAARNLDNLKLINAERNPEIVRLRRELDLFLGKHHARIVAEARSALSQAKLSSRRHRLELAKMKEVAKRAAHNVLDCLERHRHIEIARAA